MFLTLTLWGYGLQSPLKVNYTIYYIQWDLLEYSNYYDYLLLLLLLLLLSPLQPVPRQVGKE